MRARILRAARAGNAWRVLPTPPAPPRTTPRGTRAGAPGRELWAGLHLTENDPAGQLAQLAACVQRFTPRVSLAPPDGLLLEVQGSLHLFGGVAGLRGALLAECQPLKVRPLLAFAPTALAALVMARAGKSLEVLEPAQLTGKLSPLPLSSLRWPEDILARLARMGVRTVGAALRLPRAGFARRFGEAQLAMLDALTGRTPEVRVTYRVPERFRRRRELGCELENHGLLLASLAPLLAELSDFLAARELGVVELECLLAHRHAPPTRCVVRLAAPATEVQRLTALLGEHLTALELPEPVRACELAAAVLMPHRPESASLWQPGERGGSLGQESCDLIERLRARLGAEAVHGLTRLLAHRPEKAWEIAEPPSALRPRTTIKGSADTAPGRRRPLWLLPAPQRLPVREGLPRRRGPLRLLSEPERIETGWWDGGEIARDYYTAVDIHGVHLWVFRERDAPHEWFLHGVFG